MKEGLGELHLTTCLALFTAYGSCGTTGYLLLTTHTILRTPCCFPHAMCHLLPCYPLPTAHCSFLATRYSPLTAHCSLLTAHCPLPTAHYSLPTASCPLPTAHCPLPSTHCPLLDVGC